MLLFDTEVFDFEIYLWAQKAKLPGLSRNRPQSRDCFRRRSKSGVQGSRAIIMASTKLMVDFYP